MSTLEETEVYHSAEEGEESTVEEKLSRLEVKSKGDSSEEQQVGNPRLVEEDQDVVQEGKSEVVLETGEKTVNEKEQDSSSKNKVELTEEQRRELVEQGDILKRKGNDHYKSEEYELAMECYTKALDVYPTDCCKEVSVAHGNLSACWVKLNEHEKVIEECTKALDVDDKYVKVLLRRAQSYEATEKLESAFEDYKRVLELDHTSSVAREAVLVSSAVCVRMTRTKWQAANIQNCSLCQ
jgi:import receptor subunit TOM70